MTLTLEILSALVAVARDAALTERAAGVPAIDPLPGDLVVAIELRPRASGSLDPDAIGWLVAHGRAAYRKDGTGPMREVWDIKPLSEREEGQRWENITFVRVTSRVFALIEAMLRAP